MHVNAGAPYVARNDGNFVAGNAVKPLAEVPQQPREVELVRSTAPTEIDPLTPLGTHTPSLDDSPYPNPDKYPDNQLGLPEYQLAGSPPSESDEGFVEPTQKQPEAEVIQQQQETKATQQQPEAKAAQQEANAEAPQQDAQKSTAQNPASSAKPSPAKPSNAAVPDTSKQNPKPNQANTGTMKPPAPPNVYWKCLGCNSVEVLTFVLNPL